MANHPFAPILLVLAVALAVPTAGMAKEEKKEGGKEDSARATDGAFDLAPVAVPVIVQGRVLNYIFVTVRLTPTGLDKTAKLKTKEPFFRDALVRAAHRTPFTVPTDYNRVDEARISAAVLALSPAIAGPGQVRSAMVSRQQPKNIRRNPRPVSP